MILQKRLVIPLDRAQALKHLSTAADWELQTLIVVKNKQHNRRNTNFCFVVITKKYNIHFRLENREILSNFQSRNRQLLRKFIFHITW